MRKLATRIERKGFVYHEIKRNAYKALYAQLDKSNKLSLVGYEVFYIGHAKQSEAFGKLFPEREVYPGDNDFGVTAWSVGTDYLKALERYTNLHEKVRPESV